MLIDTHCHLDASEFADDRDAVIQAALDTGLRHLVVPAVHVANFKQVAALAAQHDCVWYALGLHPLYIDNASPSDLVLLQEAVAQALQQQQKLLAIGEIGLDFFVSKHNREVQLYFFCGQLQLAKTFNLPVILHVRRAVDDILKQLRRIKVQGGIAHAFNGSQQQAEMFIELGFKLGFGGAMTYDRALKIRALAKNLPIDSIVLETDAPDIPPAWIGTKARNSPKELYKIAEVLAEIRAITPSQIIEITGKNACQVFPVLGDLYT